MPRILSIPGQSFSHSPLRRGLLIIMSVVKSGNIIAHQWHIQQTHFYGLTPSVVMVTVKINSILSRGTSAT